MEGIFFQLLLPVHLLHEAALSDCGGDHELEITGEQNMSVVDEIQIMVAWADIILVTAGYILIRVIVVVVCVMGIIIIKRRIYRGS